MIAEIKILFIHQLKVDGALVFDSFDFVWAISELMFTKAYCELVLIIVGISHDSFSEQSKEWKEFAEAWEKSYWYYKARVRHQKHDLKNNGVVQEVKNWLSYDKEFIVPSRPPPK